MIPITPDGARFLQLTGDNAAITDIKRYTTIERMDGFIQLSPNCPAYRTFKKMGKGVYTVTVEPHHSVVRDLYRGGPPGTRTGPIVHDGKCLRIHGTNDGPEAGILLHEAPHVGWLTGCISPRTRNTRDLELENKANKNQSYMAMLQLFRLIGDKQADFFVLDY
jgi:hypothetical protein